MQLGSRQAKLCLFAIDILPRANYPSGAQLTESGGEIRSRLAVPSLPEDFLC